MTCSGRSAASRASSVSSTIQSLMPSTSACVSRSCHRQLAPGQVALGAGGRAPGLVGDLEQAVGGIGPAVEHEVLDPLAQIRVEVVEDRQGAGIDDGHVQPGARWRDTRKTAWMASRTGLLPRNENETLETPPLVQHARQLGLDPADGLDEGHGVVVVLVDAGADGEDVGVEDDVLGGEADLLGEQAVRRGAPISQPTLDGLGLAVLVEGHDHDRGAVAMGQARLAQELLLALLERDGVDDGPTLRGAQAGLDDRPLGRVDHEGHAGDVRLGREQAHEAGHGRLRVEHALVHVDVDDLGAVLDLLAGDLHGLVVVRLRG